MRYAVIVAVEDAVDCGCLRAELTAYCRRMLGSTHDAEDAVQETLLRAWRASGRFQGRSSVRTWVYRIATNVCLTALRRAAHQPIPTEEVDRPADPPDDPDPSDRALDAERLRLAIVAAVGALPPRQRAVLLLRDVLSWRASEVAELLGTTVAAVNSALQRAHAALGTIDLEELSNPGDAGARDLVARYVTAFATDDVDGLIALATGA
jgi:RNA polymerase sigma-70 factor, ECF subfamily